jgi:methylenetetrahydrofolate dehydrogenase (NADP+)/methenyltetrahydrofolate cyclohydrolase
MTAEVIDVRKIAEKLREGVAAEVAALGAEGIQCGPAAIVVGDDDSSHAYGRRLSRIAAETGVAYRQVALAAASTQDEVLAAVRELNDDPSVSGVVILRPLPDHVAEVAVFQAVSPVKDIESVHPENGGLPGLRPRGRRRVRRLVGQ